MLHVSRDHPRDVRDVNGSGAGQALNLKRLTHVEGFPGNVDRCRNAVEFRFNV